MSNLLNFLQSFRTILCVCPCCGDIVRLSDLHLRLKGVAPRTWLDTYESKSNGIEEKETAFEQREQELRHAAVERGRKKVPKLVCKCIDNDIAELKYHPYDIKAVYHPVDFVVFNGLDRKETLDDITFLSRKTSSEMLRKIRASVQSAIRKEKYDWKVARVSISGEVTLE
jgi:predicted Holliday junction resolvase-like endonuclease